MQAAPHFLLLADARRRKQQGDWRFVLQTASGERHLEAADAEQATSGERLELLAVVRGLEALDQPSRVTLLTPSSYVSRGLSYGLEEWRSNNWQWERYGQMVPVKDGDLWRRLDHAQRFHHLECRRWKVDRSTESSADGRAVAGDNSTDVPTESIRSSSKHIFRRTMLAIRRRYRESIGRVKLRLAQLGTGILPRPWLE
jgi:ribonuclease HI